MSATQRPQRTDAPAASATGRVTRVLIEQDGTWYRLGVEEWATRVATGLAGKRWKRPLTALRRRPATVAVRTGRRTTRAAASATYEPVGRGVWVIESPGTWTTAQWERAAWQLHDELGAHVLPLCPWCGWDAGMARGKPVPMTATGALQERRTFACRDCRTHFIEHRDGGFDELA